VSKLKDQINAITPLMKVCFDFVKNEYNSLSSSMKKTLLFLFIMSAGFALFALQIFIFGLGYTGLSNYVAWGVWIGGDLSLIVLGGGAFFTSFMLYILRRDEFQPIINSAILIGLLCYAFTFIFLGLDVGQPLRFWFAYLYPNWGEHLMPQSMLTEVVFCITFYFMVLVGEFTPIILGQKLLDRFPVIHQIGHYIHKLMWIGAAVGTFLSFFHQGSLGGTYGVLFAKPGWFRPHLFFLFIVSALAAGTSFTILITWLAGKVKKKDVVPFKTYVSLARVSGFMFLIYFIFRIYDIYLMITKYVPAFDRNFWDLWGGTYGLWMLVLELIACFIPVILLNIKAFREKEKTLIIGVGSAVFGMMMNRFAATLHGFTVPNFPWKAFTPYGPTIQEIVTTLGIFSSMALIYIFCAKYLPIFPHLDKQEH